MKAEGRLSTLVEEALSKNADAAPRDAALLAPLGAGARRAGAAARRGRQGHRHVRARDAQALEGVARVAAARA